MKNARFFWWYMGAIALVISAPFLLFASLVFLMWLSERPESFEHKVQLEGAAVWSRGQQSQSWDGDVCDLNYRLEFALTGQSSELVEQIDTFSAGVCDSSQTLSRATWFKWGNGVYLRVVNDLYRYGPSRQWRKESPSDYGTDWSLSRFDFKQGRVIYTRTQGKRTFYRVLQLPQNADSPLVEIQNSEK